MLATIYVDVRLSMPSTYACNCDGNVHRSISTYGHHYVHRYVHHCLHHCVHHCITMFITMCIITDCIAMCITVCIINDCITTYITMCINMCITMCINMCITMYITMCITMCTGKAKEGLLSPTSNSQSIHMHLWCHHTCINEITACTFTKDKCASLCVLHRQRERDFEPASCRAHAKDHLPPPFSASAQTQDRQHAAGTAADPLPGDNYYRHLHSESLGPTDKQCIISVVILRAVIEC